MANKYTQAKQLGFDVPFVVEHPQEEAGPEVIITLKPPVPPTKWGEFTWWKCVRCGRYYDAPAQMRLCVLCQFKALGGGLTKP